MGFQYIRGRARGANARHRPVIGGCYVGLAAVSARLVAGAWGGHRAARAPAGEPRWVHLPFPVRGGVRTTAR